MIKNLRINLICIAKSIFVKIISALIVILFGMSLNVFSPPSDETHLSLYIIAILMVSYMMLINPLQYFITYLFHDIKIQIYIDTENDTLRIIDSKVEYLFQINEVMRITKFLERRYKNDYLGYFYYKIETIRGSFYISMFTTWTLSTDLPKIPYNEIDLIFPFIKKNDIAAASNNED